MLSDMTRHSLSLFAGLLLATASLAAEPARPNIVVFLTDDLGYLDTAPYGAKDVRTPNLSRLAEAGCTFANLFVASPSCAPSRAALLTGLMPARNGAEANHSRPREDVKKLPAYLKEHGYEVAAFGKVAHYRQNGLYGFDTHDDRPDMKLVGEFLGKRDGKKPLCLFVGLHEPHVPWPANDGYDPKAIHLPPTHLDTPETREFRARYYTAVTTADTKLGEVYDLARKSFGDNLLFLFLSDHGAQWPFGKWNLYDAGIRVPFVAVWPGKVKPGSKGDALLSSVDLLPTLVEAAGGKASNEIDGRSFLGVLTGQSSAHRDRVFATHTNDGAMNVYPIRCVRTREFKYIRNLLPDCEHTTHIDRAKPVDGVHYWRSWVAATGKDPKAAALVQRYHERPAEELYDLSSDPHEQTNLAADPKHADRLKSLRAELDSWMKDQKDEGKVFNKPRKLPAKKK
jgi:arylsulfatase A-like enzyme